MYWNFARYGAYCVLSVTRSYYPTHEQIGLEGVAATYYNSGYDVTLSSAANFFVPLSIHENVRVLELLSRAPNQLLQTEFSLSLLRSLSACKVKYSFEINKWTREILITKKITKRQYSSMTFVSVFFSSGHGTVKHANKRALVRRWQ